MEIAKEIATYKDQIKLTGEIIVSPTFMLDRNIIFRKRKGQKS
jgi:hypothetical protein